MRMSAGRQGGIALVVGLVMLTVLTLLVVAAVKIGILELKIGGVSYGAAQNFANIDLALSRFMNDNGGRFTPGCLQVNRTDPFTQAFSCFYPEAARPPDVAVSGSNATRYTATYALYAGKVDVQAQEISCLSNSGLGTGNFVADTARGSPGDLFSADMTARAQGNIAGLTIVRQGATRRLGAGTCGNG